jgi:hypothetical protein
MSVRNSFTDVKDSVSIKKIKIIYNNFKKQIMTDRQDAKLNMYQKIFLIIVVICCSITAYSQNGITFQVEELSKPEKLLPVRPQNEIWGTLISRSNIGVANVKADIIAQSKAPGSLVDFGYHSFFNGMYQAYADHRPFVLSPDMIWLLIAQGFAQHVNVNAEELRDYFVDFSGQLSLVVTTDKVRLDNPESPWDEIFPEFTKQITEHTGDDLMKLLTADFSTTTPVEKLASEITIMEAMQPYFEFIVMYIVCGIPEITLTGTPDDWQKVLDKTRQLSKYDLEWWTKELTPLLEEFVKASKGNVDKDFWRNMFKCHSQEKYGAPKIIDGWIVKFFPYNKNGIRNNLKQLEGGNSLPEEIVKVDLKFIEQYDDGTTVTTPLELWAGFAGLEQNSENFALKPVIAWMIRKKDITAVREKLEKENSGDWGGMISIRVKEVPPELLELEAINNLDIKFIGKIIIPDELAKVKIKTLRLSGVIDEAEKERIENLFPNSTVIINGETR